MAVISLGARPLEPDFTFVRFDLTNIRGRDAGWFLLELVATSPSRLFSRLFYRVVTIEGGIATIWAPTQEIYYSDDVLALPFTQRVGQASNVPTTIELARSGLYGEAGTEYTTLVGTLTYDTDYAI